MKPAEKLSEKPMRGWKSLIVCDLHVQYRLLSRNPLPKTRNLIFLTYSVRIEDRMR